MTQSQVMTVAQLDRLIKRMLEGSTADVQVRGEISNLHRAGSGHVYFSLKDEKENALIDAVMYRSAPPRARKQLREGERVLLRGRATLYAPRGRLQFVAENLLDAGRGVQLEALEKLKRKLAAEGLFAPERKQPLPADPQWIAVLSSRDGAAIHDVVRVARGRGPVNILLLPTFVQGPQAAPSIVVALQRLQHLPHIDVVILTRGGGSAEDLAAYNDERVVRAIAALQPPLISAVGHEVDVSLSDWVADRRAATPSQAAELAVPDVNEKLTHLDHLRLRLRRAMERQIQQQRQHVRLALGRLDALSPLRVLARGYAVASMSDGQLVRRADQVQPGERLQLRLAHGQLEATVDAVHLAAEATEAGEGQDATTLG